jgi:hypothetical protein
MGNFKLAWGNIVGHYDDIDEEFEVSRRKEKTRRLAVQYNEIKSFLTEIRTFIRRRGDSRLQNAWDTFEAELTFYRYTNGALIEDPNILLDKLKKV